MDEQKTEEKVKEETKTKADATPTEDAGDKYETTPIIERAREEREKLEVAIKAQKLENDRTEKILARKALGGETEAGTESKPQFTDEEKATRARIKAVGDVAGAPWAKNYE